MIVIRAPSSFSLDKLNETTEELLEKAVYKNDADPSEMPYVSNCINTVFYLINHSTDLHLHTVYWIGNAPQRLVKLWNFEVIDTQDLKTGDIVFVQNKKTKKNRLITHVLMRIGEEFFHCTNKTGGCEWLNQSQFEKRFDQPFTKEELMENFDPRSRSYAKLHSLT